MLLDHFLMHIHKMFADGSREYILRQFIGSPNTLNQSN